MPRYPALQQSAETAGRRSGRRALAGALLVVLFVVSACSGGDEETTTTTTAPDQTTVATTLPGGPTSTSSPDPGGNGTTSTTGAGPTTTFPGVPDYSIEARQVGSSGDTVVVLVPPGTYTDIDLEDIVLDVVDRFAPIEGVHVVDDVAAVPLVLQPASDLTPEQTVLLNTHYFVRLEEGFRMVFVGPFSSFGEIVLGS